MDNGITPCPSINVPVSSHVQYHKLFQILSKQKSFEDIALFPIYVYVYTVLSVACTGIIYCGASSYILESQHHTCLSSPTPCANPKFPSASSNICLWCIQRQRLGIIFSYFLNSATSRCQFFRTSRLSCWKKKHVLSPCVHAAHFILDTQHLINRIFP